MRLVLFSALSAVAAKNNPIQYINGLHFDTALRNTPYGHRPPSLVAFYDTESAEQVFAKTQWNFPKIGKGLRGAKSFLDDRTKLAIGFYDVQHHRNLTTFDWIEDKMDLPKRFGITKFPALVLLPPAYVAPENITVKPIVWDSKGDWRDWFSENVKGMPKPSLSYFSGSQLGTRDSCELGEWTRCMNFPKQLKRYTEEGYMKIEMPDEIYKRMMAFYHRNTKTRFKENWPPDGCQINFHESPMTMVYLDNEAYERDAIGKLVAPILANWTNTHDLELTSFYGIREYHRGNELHMHIDRIESHAISAILNIEQDKMDENWELEVIDLHGKWQKIPMKAKEMILYESSTVIHGRPSRLKGDMFINAFVHFRPRDWRVYSHDDRRVNTKSSDGGGAARRYIVLENKSPIEVQVWKWMNADMAIKQGEVILPGKEYVFPAQEVNEAFFWSKSSTKYAVLSHFNTGEESNHYVLQHDAVHETYTTQTVSISKKEKDLIQAAKRRPVKLHNKSKKKMDVYWDDKEGGIFQGSVEPGEHMDQETFPGHKFIWREHGSDEDHHETLIEHGTDAYHFKGHADL